MLTEQIKAFCDPKASRYALGLPWLADGRVCATDGSAIVSCDPGVYDGELAAADAKVPDPTEFLKPIDDVSIWQELSFLADCPKCGRTGRYEEKCPHCGGKTAVWCMECSIVLGNCRVRGACVRHFGAFPSCQWGVVGNNPTENVFFRFDGGRGVLAPLT